MTYEEYNKIYVNLNKEEYNQVVELVDYLNSLKTYEEFEKELPENPTQEDIESIAKKAGKEFDVMKIADVAYFTDEQVLLYRDLYKNSGQTFSRGDSKLKSKSLVKRMKNIKNIYELLDLYDKRNSLNLNNEYLNSTIVRFTNININKEGYFLEILPMNYLESLLMTYVRHQQFEKENDKFAIRKIKNILKNGNLDFDKVAYPVYDDIIKLLN